MLRTVLYRAVLPFCVVLIAIMFFIHHMHKSTLAGFYGHSLSVLDHLSWYRNHTQNTVKADVVLKAQRPERPGGTTKDWCPQVTPKNGVVTIGYIEEQPICCSLGKGQRYIHYREDETQITFLCGHWPNTEVVSIDKNGFQAARFSAFGAGLPELAN